MNTDERKREREREKGGGGGGREREHRSRQTDKIEYCQEKRGRRKIEEESEEVQQN